MISTAKEKKKTAVKRVCFLEVRGPIDTTCITTTTRSHYIAKRTKRRYAGLELAPLSHRSPTSESFTRLCALHTTRACYCRLSSFSAKRSEKKNLTYTYTYIVYYIYIHIYSKSKDKDNQNNEKS